MHNDFIRNFLLAPYVNVQIHKVLPTFRDRELVENTGYGVEFAVNFLYMPCNVNVMDRKVAASEHDAVNNQISVLKIRVVIRVHSGMLEYMD